MRRRMRRALAFLLVPLSAVPLVAIAPHVAPSVERRVEQLRGDSEQVAPARPVTAPTESTTR